METRSGLAFQPQCGMHAQGYRRSAVTLGTGYLSHMAFRGCLLVGSVSFLREEKKLGGTQGTVLLLEFALCQRVAEFLNALRNVAVCPGSVYRYELASVTVPGERMLGIETYRPARITGPRRGRPPGRGGPHGDKTQDQPFAT